MRFKWNVAFAALAVAGVMVALFAAVACLCGGNYIGAVIAGIAICGCAFAAAGLIGGMEEPWDD